MVEQAPYSPRKGTSAARAAYPEPMHWLSRSPASMRSRSGVCRPARFNAASRARPCMADSACSQVFAPNLSSLQVWSKCRPRGPELSLFPAAEPKPMITGG